MDPLNHVNDLIPPDAADRVDMVSARNALHREITRAERTGARPGRHRLRLAVGAGGGVAAVGAAVVTGIVLGGAGTVVSAVAPPSSAPFIAAPEPATAAELLEQAATAAADSIDVTAQDQELAPGQYLKVRATRSSWEFLSPGQPAWQGGFSPVREGAVAAYRVDDHTVDYYAADPLDSVHGGSEDSLPREFVGDRAALEAAWNANADLFGGTFAERLAAPENDVYYGREWVEWFTSNDPGAPGFDREKAGITEEEENEMVATAKEVRDGRSPVDQYGAYPTDPAEFLTAWGKWHVMGGDSWVAGHTEQEVAKRQAEVDALAPDALAQAKEDAIGDILIQSQVSDFVTAPAAYRALMLRTVATAGSITVDEHVGDIADIRFSTADADFVASIDVVRGQVLSVDQFTKREEISTADGTNVIAEIGSTSLLPEGTPDSSYRVTIEVVDSAPTEGLRKPPVDESTPDSAG